MLISRLEDTNVAMIETDHEIGTFFIKAVVFQLPSSLDRTFVFYVKDFYGKTTEQVFSIPDSQRFNENEIMQKLGCNVNWATMLMRVIKEMGMGVVLKAED